MKGPVDINIVRGGKKIYIIMLVRLILSIIGLISSIIILFKDINGELGNFGFHTLLIGFLVLIVGLLHLIDKKYLIKIRNAVPIKRCDFIDKNIKSKSDIFSGGITSTNPNKMAIFNVHIEMDDNPEPMTMRTYKTKEQCGVVEEVFTEIKPKSSHDIDLLIKPEEALNFQFDKSGIIKKLMVTEIYAP